MGRISITNNPTSSEDDPEKQTQAVSDGSPLKISVDAAHSNESLTLEQYRALVGMPQESPLSSFQSRNANGFVKTQHGLISLSNLNNQHEHHDHPAQIRAATVTKDGFSAYGSRFMIASHLFSRPAAMHGKSRFWRRTKNPLEAAEYATSLYYTLLRLESDQHRLFHFYNTITYFCLVLQLVIASVLIILGAILSNRSNSSHRISIAVLGAVTGVLTGLLSLLKGQGYPTRMVQYADRLRQVRDKLEFMERALRANCGAIVTFQDVLGIWNEFEKVRNEQSMNRPDVWTTWNQLEQPLMQVARQQQQQSGHQQKSNPLPFMNMQTQASASEAAAATAPTATHQNKASITQQNPQFTPTPTRGNTIRISNGGTNKETQP